MKRRGDGVGYQLGVDIGTTHTAAAVARQGRAEMFILGDGSATIPSVLFLGTDGHMVVGDPASEQGFADPARVARSFKRPMGDSTPIVLGDTPYFAEALIAEMLTAVVEAVSETEGGPPDLVTVTHPGHWDAYRTDLLRRAIGLAGLGSFRTLSDPEAAAVFHAATAPTNEGEVLVVYDLGGGTFDATVARRGPLGFDIVGKPDGIDRLGGIDFDEAVLAHVSRAVGVAPADFEDDDPTTVAALAHLRQECATIKETLSTATEVSVPVFLPGGQREVGVTRDDLEAMVGAAVAETIEVLRRTLHGAGVEPSGVDTVILMGGSSHMPLVARMVSEELGRPVTVAGEPKHGVALGAALSMAQLSTVPAGTVLAGSLPAGTAMLPVVPRAEAREPGSPEVPSVMAVAEPDLTGTDAGATRPTSPAEPAVAIKTGPPSMSLLTSLATVVVSLAIVAAAVAAGTLIAVGQVGAGIGTAVVGVAALVCLLLMVRRPATSGPPVAELLPSCEKPSL